MNILIVEDDDFKRKRITECVEVNFPKLEILNAKSVNSAKRILKKTDINITLMDMSLPNYDVTAIESGGRPHTFGGRELLSYLLYRDIDIPVIVITQFRKFDSESGEIDLKTLRRSIMEEYGSNFKELISFDDNIDLWKDKLVATIRLVIHEYSHSRR